MIEGSLATRYLDGGRILAVLPRTYGKAMLTLGRDRFTYDDSW